MGLIISKVIEFVGFDLFGFWYGYLGEEFFCGLVLGVLGCQVFEVLDFFGVGVLGCGSCRY